jgi:putative polyhydroxyalkanoate system protein
MSIVTADVPHSLGAAEARRRIESGTGGLARHLPAGATVQPTWTGNRLHLDISAMGQQLRGRIDVQERLVRVEVTLPPALAFLAPMIEAGIRRTGTELLQDQRKA